MAIGLADANNIFYSAATGVGNPVVYVGSKTGRDGIHGATMASEEFSEDSEEKRPTVQVGDPFTEKLLIEACLELMATDAIVAIQDMGAAGLTSSSVEMATNGKAGIRLDMDKVPCREEGMTPYEMMLSESQERMLMVLRPEKADEAKAIFTKWGLDFAIVGKTTDTLRFRIFHEGEQVADLPIKDLGDEAPEYDSPWTEPEVPAALSHEDVPPPNDITDALLTIMAHPQGCSRRWVWEQYDHMVLGDTVQRPGGDAAVVRVHGTNKAIAACCDVTPRYVLADPAMGTKQAVAETWRDLSAVGAEPLAITDNLNYANPERPEIMGQFVQSIKGMTEACEALAYPVVAGNVSLYNETNGVGIPPTPAIGGVGIIKDLSKRVDMAAKQAGNLLIALGKEEGHLGQSLYQQIISGALDGAPPPVDLHAEKATGEFVRTLIREQAIRSAHDISDGGLLVAIAEMALAGNVGVEIFPYEGTLPAHAIWFGEDQARYVVEVTPETADGILERTRQNELPARIVGQLGGDSLKIGQTETLELAALKSAHEAWFPNYMDSAAS